MKQEVKAAQQTGDGTRTQSSCLEMQGWHYARARALSLRSAQASWGEQKHAQKNSEVQRSTLDLLGARSRLKEKVWPRPALELGSLLGSPPKGRRRRAPRFKRKRRAKQRARTARLTSAAAAHGRSVLRLRHPVTLPRGLVVVLPVPRVPCQSVSRALARSAR